MHKSNLIDALNQASSLELFQLSEMLDRLMSDPRRIAAIRVDMRMGQTVRFWNAQSSTMQVGKVVAMNPRHVKVQAVGSGVWTLPYAAIEPPVASDEALARHREERANMPARPTREDFSCGEKVSFEDRYLQMQFGVIVRMNQKTATVDIGDGQIWRVPFGLLRPAVDI